MAAQLARELAETDDATIAETFRRDVFDLWPDARDVIDQVAIQHGNAGPPIRVPAGASSSRRSGGPLALIDLADDYLDAW